MKNTLIVTGCAGFIGFNWLKKYVKTDYFKTWDEIFSIDCLNYASDYNKDEYLEICKEYKILSMIVDINVLKKSSHVFEDKSITILNFASQSHVDRSIASPSQLYFDNIGIPACLIDWVGGHEKIKIFNHISTDEVYGDINLSSREDRTKWFQTNFPFNPSNPYSASKVAQEAYLMSISRTFKMPLQTFRMGNQFGLHQHPEKLLPASILRVMRKEPIGIYGNGKNCRQWTWVETTVEVLTKYLHHPVATNPSHPYNVTHIADMRFLLDNNFVVYTMRQLLANKFGIQSEIKYVDDRKGHDMVYALNVSESVAVHFDGSFQDKLEKVIEFYVEGFKNGTFAK